MSVPKVDLLFTQDKRSWPATMYCRQFQLRRKMIRQCQTSSTSCSLSLSYLIFLSHTHTHTQSLSLSFSLSHTHPISLYLNVSSIFSSAIITHCTCLSFRVTKGSLCRPLHLSFSLSLCVRLYIIYVSLSLGTSPKIRSLSPLRQCDDLKGIRN